MSRLKKKTDTVYGIVGLGRFGCALAIQLAESGKEIMVLDADEDRVALLREYTENAYIVHSLDKKVLEETGIQNCDVAVVCIGEKMDTSILTTLHLKSLGVPKVIAKANSMEHGEILEKLGAEVVYPERDMAIRLARRLEPAGIQDLIEVSDKINVSILEVPAAYKGKGVAEIDLRKEYGLNLIALRRDGNILTDITPALKLKEGDAMYVMGDYDKINRFELDYQG